MGGFRYPDKVNMSETLQSPEGLSQYMYNNNY